MVLRWLYSTVIFFIGIVILSIVQVLIDEEYDDYWE